MRKNTDSVFSAERIHRSGFVFKDKLYPTNEGTPQGGLCEALLRGDFHNDDFKFVGLDFKHWREKRNGSGKYFIVEPTEQSIKTSRRKSKMQPVKVAHMRFDKGVA